jgi:16S rRNA (guanine527-N7)-methyltransferase
MPIKNGLVAGANELGIFLSDEQVTLFGRYQDLLLEWNQRMNLTAVRDARLIQQRHFVDSLTCSLVTGDLNDQFLIDVGSGAGFPGLPLKILFPDLKLSLLESIGKKAIFLQAIVDELELSDVRVICGRAEDIGQSTDHREIYDWVVARAVARLRILVEYLLPFARIGGHILTQKGRQAEVEMSEAENGISALGGRSPRLIPVQLLKQEEPSNLVLIEKIKSTPDKYPRRIGIPAKRPL